MKKIVFWIPLFILVVFVINCYNSDRAIEKMSKVVNYSGNNLMVSVDGVSVDSLPSEGNYYLIDYKCSNDNTEVIWDRINYKLNVSNGNKKGNLVCNLKFKSQPLLSDMEVGSYVSYVGSRGNIGDSSVTCKVNGNVSASVDGVETESSNSCNGQNAREDLDISDYTYGYCSSSNYKFYTTGWRIAYKDVDNKKAVIVSAGSPECLARESSVANAHYIQMANSKALKYCNADYVDGDCSCVDSDNDGLCDSQSLDAWAINDKDFYMITKAISGFGKRLSNDSSDLGDEGGSLGAVLFCSGKRSYEECGYNNDLIDNGGYYWFAAQNNSNETTGLAWSSYRRSVISVSEQQFYGLRPMISLASTVYVTGGNGTMNDPYTIANS